MDQFHEMIMTSKAAGHKGSVEIDTVDCLNWVCGLISETPTLAEVDLRNNNFDGVSFDWGEIADNAGLTKQELKATKKKLQIESEAGGALSDTSEDSQEEEDSEE